jgi:hypothetical protein
MSRLSQAEIDDIRARNPIEHVAEQYVRLRRAAGRLVGPCPMCGGRATSQRFEVFANEDSWACAVCHDGGDVIRLVEKVEGLDFRAAIERLGGAAQIDPDQARRLFEAREKKRLAREKQTETFREKSASVSGASGPRLKPSTARRRRAIWKAAAWRCRRHVPACAIFRTRPISMARRSTSAVTNPRGQSTAARRCSPPSSDRTADSAGCTSPICRPTLRLASSSCLIPTRVKF